MKIVAILTVVALALIGCAGVTDVVSTGPDTYMVAAQGVLGNSSSGKQAFKAQKQAADFCSAKGMQVETISAKQQGDGWGKVASAQVDFKCIAK